MTCHCFTVETLEKPTSESVMVTVKCQGASILCNWMWRQLRSGHRQAGRQRERHTHTCAHRRHDAKGPVHPALPPQNQIASNREVTPICLAHAGVCLRLFFSLVPVYLKHPRPRTLPSSPISRMQFLPPPSYSRTLHSLSRTCCRSRASFVSGNESASFEISCCSFDAVTYAGRQAGQAGTRARA
jgi:hypothetical protein